MKKQFFALSITAALIANPLMAFAAPAFEAPVTVNANELAQLMPNVDQKTVAALTVSLNQVEDMIINLKKIDDSNEKDPVLRVLNTMQVIIVAMNATAAKVHLSDKKTTSNTLLLLSTASGAVDAAIRIYKRSGKVNPTDLSKVLLDVSENLRKSGIAHREIADVDKSLREVRTIILKNQSQLTMALEDLNGPFGLGDMATIASFAYLLFHMFAPKAIVKEADAVVKVVAPDAKEITSTIRQVSQKLNEVSSNAKATSQIGLGLSGLPDVLAMIFGLNGTAARNMTLETIDNLSKAANDIQAQIDLIQERTVKP